MENASATFVFAPAHSVTVHPVSLMHQIDDLFDRFARSRSSRSGDDDGVAGLRMRDVLPAFDFCVVDLETTGMNPHAGAEIIEIGAVRIEDGELSDTFQTLLEPRRSIPANITELTGITNRMVRGKPSVEEVLPEFVRFLDDAILLAHNFRFDFSFLDHYHGEDFYNDYVCTVKLARNVANFESNSLDYLNEHLSLNREDAHRALDDAVATGKLFKVLSKNVTRPGDYHRGGIPLCVHQVNPGALVMNVPGVGRSKATKIGQNFTHTRELLRATEEDLRTVPGIGPKLAGSIRSVTRDFTPVPPGRNDPVKLDEDRRPAYDRHHRDQSRSVEEFIRQTR